MENYKIIGGDGREYGPASLEEIRSWIREGRIGRGTLIWRDDLATWTPAGQLSELQSDLTALHGPEIAFRRVGFFPRLAAYILDMFVLWAISSLIWPIFANAFHIVEPVIPQMKTLEEILQFYQANSGFFYQQMLVTFAIYLVYDVLLNGTFGATVGKMAIGARIVRMDGSRIGYATALLRWLGARVSDAACYIGYFFILFRKDKRALHDLIAGTQVIYKR